MRTSTRPAVHAGSATRCRHRATWALMAAICTVAATVVLAPPTQAVATSGWATWTDIRGSANDYATTMQLPAKGFPQATMASDSRGNVALAAGTSTFLGAGTPPGAKYGSSKGSRYITLRPKADNATSPSRTTFTFDHATPGSGWTFVLGDIDSDKVQISAKDATGEPVDAATINAWETGRGPFNYASGGTDVPSWDAASSTLTGNATAADTDGASSWFEPDLPLSSLTFLFTRRAGFPVYQVWFASSANTIGGTVADVSGAGHTCPVTGATVRLLGPDGGELDSVHPAADGAYSFGQYAQQGYTVGVDVPAGCAVTGPEQRTVSNVGGDATADFTLRQIVPQSVRGTVATTDGTRVPDATVTLSPPGGAPPETTTTDGEGNYLFDDNDPGTGYRVTVTPPDGFRVDGAATTTFDVTANDPVPPKDFTLAELPDLSGVVTGAGEPLGGVTVELTPSGGGTPTSTTSTGEGSYTFAHLPASDYDVSVDTPAGYRPAAPRKDVHVTDDDVSGVDFALTRPGSIGGSVTEDAIGGTPVPDTGVTISGSTSVAPLHTDEAGDYFVDDLEPGTYSIELTVPDGFAAVGATTRTVMITSAGEIRDGQDFVVVRAATSTSPAPGGSTTPRPTVGSTPTSGSSTPAGGGQPTGASGSGGFVASTGVAARAQLLTAFALLALGTVALLVGMRPVRRRTRHTPTRR